MKPTSVSLGLTLDLGPTLPLHTWRGRLKAVWLVLRGKAVVLDVNRIEPPQRVVVPRYPMPTRGGRSVMR